MSRIVSTLALVLGMGLVVASFAWRPSRGAWTEEQAANYSQASADLHRLSYEAAIAQEIAKKAPGDAQKKIAEKRLAKVADASAPIDPKTASAERTIAAFEEAKKRYDSARADLDQARSSSGTAALVIRWLGIGAAVLGLAGLATFRAQES